MAVVDILRNVNLFVDGRGHAGAVQMVQLPKLAVKTEEHRAGGMDAPIEIDMGLEKLEATWSMDSVDATMLRRWGLAPNNLTPCVFRGALQSEDATVKAVAATCRGVLREVDWGDWKPGEKATLKCTMAVRRYRLEIDGETIHDIDVLNMIRIVDGVDQLAAQRAALGI